MTTTGSSLDHVVGLREEAYDNVSLSLARRVCALLNRDGNAIRMGDPLPRGWQFMLFTPLAPQTSLGQDGTPAAAGEVHIPTPPEFPRRMMGGRRLAFFGDIPIGADVRRVSEVISANLKTGKTGRFVVATTRHKIFVGDAKEPALQEDSDGIFREAAGAVRAPAVLAAGPPPRQARHSETVVTDPTMLFRYSAVHFNTHRIHYDYPYATDVECYPGLVVNAGLSVLMLRDFAARLGEKPFRNMTSRNVGPLYCGEEFTLCANETPGGGFELWAEDSKGRAAAEVILGV
ncbi:MAG TPA: hypothetical protein VHZ55_32010 [Bryobacteraceae bacterium]|jgi:hydroxyacyl-ACP dehydratase HTD2-like protein with hotdog domain|nr:hypothetical protein [Bryobacteraceae bacterium]